MESIIIKMEKCENIIKLQNIFQDRRHGKRLFLQ